MGWLILLATVPPVLEAVVLIVVGFRAPQGLSPQVTAVWPYDSYHDLRWLLVYHNSWAGFVVEFLGVTALRGLLSAGLTWLAWPAESAPRPTFRWLVNRNLRVALAAALIISPWAALSVAASVVALSWVLLASLLPMLLIAPFLQRAGVTADWWRGLPSAEQVGWSTLNFLLLTVSGGLVWDVGRWAELPVVALAGAANGLLWDRTVHAAVLHRSPRWARVPIAPLVGLLVVAGAAASRVVVAGVGSPQGQWRPPLTTRPLPARADHAVIVLAGHESVYDGMPAVDPAVQRYSYRGLDARGRALPYDAHDTHRSLVSSARILRAQVDLLHGRTGRPVALAGESEGAMVAREYLRLYPRSPVDTVLLFSPLIRAGRGYYPPGSARTGWGIVAGWELRALFGTANLLGGGHSPDEGFVRSIMADAPFWRNSSLCPVPGVRMVAFIPTVSAAEAPPGPYAEIPVFQVPALHGGLLNRAVVQDDIVDFLAGEPVSNTRREYGQLQRLGAAWQAPPLAIALNPVWDDVREPDPAFTTKVCLPGR